MVSYVARRRRWYKRLRLLDEGIQVSESILADQLLDCASLTEAEKLSVRTVTSNSAEFEPISDCLRRLYHDVHQKESRKPDGAFPKGGKGGSRFGDKPQSCNFNAYHSLGRQGWQAKPFGTDRRPPPRAHFTATHEDETEEDEAETPQCAWTVAHHGDYHGEGAEDSESYNVQTVIGPP